MSDAAVRSRIVDAADRLFYARGIGHVGMDAVRDEAAVSLKAIYREFPSKEDLVLGVLERRQERWMAGIEAATAGVGDPRDRLLAIYDHLAAWFEEPDFRGCGFINAFGELGASSPRIAGAVRAHKRSFHAYFDHLVAESGAPRALGPQLAILAEGAQTTAAISGDPHTATAARAAAATLIEAATASQAG